MKNIDDLKKRLNKEFIDIDKPSIPPTYDIVVVLCAEETDITGENKERIDKGLELAEKGSKKMIFLGTKVHNCNLKKYLSNQKIELEVCYPTNRLQDSSRTQLKSLNIFLKNQPFKKLLIISHAYHIPRIKRYCSKYLVGQNFYFYPVGDIKKQSKQVQNEIDKIIRYSEKGDLSLFL